MPNLKDITEKLNALVEELKASYTSQLKERIERLVAEFGDDNSRGIEKIHQLTEEALDRFEADLDKIAADLEKRLDLELGKDLEEAARGAEEKIHNGFARIFEKVVVKVKGLFN